VAIKNFAFAPAAVTVPAGTTGTWTNTDEEPHTVSALRYLAGGES
jgi:plastocyanin